LPATEASALLPRKAGLLAQVFPVLSRLEAVAEARRPQQEVLDPHELRSRVFAALRELLERLTERHPVVLVIDDLQWADADSLALLGEVMRPPEAPPVLLIATVRPASETHETAPLADVTSAITGNVQRLELSRLPPDEARELANLLIRRGAGKSDVDA